MMTSETAALRQKRSADSLRFEDAVRAAAVPGGMPRLVDIDLGQVHDLIPWIAILDPNKETRTLKFVRAGAGIEQFLGRSAAGFDYLEIVDPAIHGEAFDSAFVMLERPCGLWQTTPGLTADGQRISMAYTGFPVYDHVRARGQLFVFIEHRLPKSKPLPRAAQVQHSTEWCWLDMKSGYSAG